MKKQDPMELLFKMGAKIATVAAIVNYVKVRYPEDEYLMKLVESIKDEETP